MNIPILVPELVEAFIFVFIRVSAIIFMIPIFGDRRVPLPVTWGLSFIISLILFPIVRNNVMDNDFRFISLMIKIAGELMIGIIIGFTARLIFAGIQIAGELTGFQMGFSVANVIDPASNQQVSLIAEIQYMVALLVFLAVDAHHIFITAIADSYKYLAPMNFHFSGALMESLLHLTRNIFIISVKVTAPIMAVLLFANVAMGVVARTVPQMNVFIVSFPIHISIGLIFLSLTMPVFVKLTKGFFLGLRGDVNMLLRLMQP